MRYSSFSCSRITKAAIEPRRSARCRGPPSLHKNFPIPAEIYACTVINNDWIICFCWFLHFWRSPFSLKLFSCWTDHLRLTFCTCWRPGPLATISSASCCLESPGWEGGSVLQTSLYLNNYLLWVQKKFQKGQLWDGQFCQGKDGFYWKPATQKGRADDDVVDSPLTSVPGDEKKFAPDGSNVRVLLRAATHVRVLPVTCDLPGQDIVTS